jgi:hypothetical protein
MDELMTSPISLPSAPAGDGGTSSAAPGRAPSPCAVADTMRRVQAALRAGAPPSYEALLAFGTPEPR